MAEKKETPRQKLISLMYLVLLAMIAMNVSKEVLSGFGHVNEKVNVVTAGISFNNLKHYSSSSEEVRRITSEMKLLSDSLYTTIERIKEQVTDRDAMQARNFEVMDSSDALDLYFFDPLGVSEEGQAFLDAIESYRSQVVALTKEHDPSLAGVFSDRFETDKVVGAEGEEVPWLAYNYEGFPLISSIAKLSLLQNSVRQSEKDYLEMVSQRFLNENLNERTRELDKERSLAKLLRPSVVPTKMNVVYRGVDNPIKVVIPGVHPDKVKVTAPGVQTLGKGNYLLRPAKGKTLEVKVSGRLSDGTRVSSTEVFRIKNIPAPTATLRGQDGSVRLPLSSIQGAKVEVTFEGFDFPVNATVTSFKYKIPGHPTKLVQGNRLPKTI